MTKTTKIVTKSYDETIALGRRLGGLLRGGEVFALTGELGSGKTVFVRGLVEGVGLDPRMVTSPTFVIMNLYQGPLSVCHIDAYRLSGATDLDDIGVRDFFNSKNICVVEWAERVADAMPPELLFIEIRIVDDEIRELTFSVKGKESEQKYSALLAAVSK
jgi:tRNA threonylcarbamoyladenosine biosynthesis protein TsaE